MPRGEHPGLLITAVDPSSPTDLNGLEPGMVITDVNKQRVSSLDDWRAILAKRPKIDDTVLRILKSPKPEFRVLLDPNNSAPDAEKAKPALWKTQKGPNKGGQALEDSGQSPFCLHGSLHKKN